MFSQILKLIPRIDFESLVKKTKAEYAAKGFSSWSQLVSMLFCQLGRAHSLREIEGGLKSCEGKLAHLGIEAPARSSLAYANAHRPWELFEGVFHGLYEKVATTVAGQRRKFRFKNKLVSRGGAGKLNTVPSGLAAPMGEDRAREPRSKRDEQTNPPQPLTGVQGQGGR
jgi:hypothetical protein